MRRFLTGLAVAAVVALALVAGAFLHDLSAARARVKAGASVLQTAAGALQYGEAGAGRPVLVIHGAAGGFDQGLDMTGALAGRGYRLIAPSRFGYLGSAMPPGAGPAAQADAYVTLLDALGVKQADVVAISAGAWSAIEFAVRHPDRCRALVLLVPADYLPPGVAIRGGAWARAVFQSDLVAWGALKLTPLAPGALSRTMLGVEPAVLAAAPPAEKARVDQILAHLLPVSARRPGMELDIRTAADRRPYALSAIRCPVLAVSAQNDVFGTAARARLIAGQAADGRAVIFPTGGHALVGRHDQALAAADAFLRAH